VNSRLAHLKSVGGPIIRLSTLRLLNSPAAAARPRRAIPPALPPRAAGDPLLGRYAGDCALGSTFSLAGLLSYGTPMMLQSSPSGGAG